MNPRKAATVAKILAGCRALMVGGDFRPTTVAIAKRAGVSRRSVFQHFAEVEAVHRAALDVRTRDAIVALIKPTGPMPDPLLTDCIVHAAVFGRPIPPAEAQTVAAKPAPAIAAAE